MANCNLSIEFDDPDRIHPGGGKVTGVVRVETSEDVSCSGLEVSSVWKTHGRGNVTSGTAATEVLFQGEWRGGGVHEYRFELPIADWPPSYHGHYLNIDHYVEARAKIPWAFDPKASEAFPVRPTCGPDGAKPVTNAIQVKGPLGCVIGLFFLAIFGVFVVAMGAAVIREPIFLGIFLLFPLIGGAIFLAKVVLPRWVLGEVSLSLAPETVSPGDRVQGELVITPRKNVGINGVMLQFQGSEKVVSGSGSNRTTHTHTFYDQTDTLQGPMTLAAGTANRFPFAVQIPEDAPYSLDLDDNDLLWNADVRVDIPRWPDWKQQLKLTVVPSGTQTLEAEPVGEQPAAVPGETASEEITFAETAGHFWNVRDDRNQAERLAAAVSGLSFPLQAHVERRLLYGGDEDPHVHENGYAVWAHYPDPPLPLVLYVPHDLADEFEQLGRDLWRGRGTIVGWDGRHRRLQVKIER